LKALKPNELTIKGPKVVMPPLGILDPVSRSITNLRGAVLTK
jgi:hypothetical protein